MSQFRGFFNSGEERPTRARRAPADAFPIRTPHSPIRNAFTLTELLVVIGLIVLLLAIAVPTFKAMSGGRSIDAAQNQLAAILGAARAEAIGLQKVRGVFFYVDPATERVNAALVREVAYTPNPAPTSSPEINVQLYIDLIPDRDPIALPIGVGLQGIDNAEVAGGARKDDGYTGYNPLTPTPPGGSAVRFGGVILFDGYGRVINKFYGLRLGEPAADNPKRTVPTRLAEFFGYDPAGAVPPMHFVARQTVAGGTGPTSMNNRPPYSLFGFVLYDAEPFRSLGYTDNDPQFDPSAGSYAGQEKSEEDWLDKNASPVLINRYNGTLIRGE